MVKEPYKLEVPKEVGESFGYTTGIGFGFCSEPKNGKIELLTRFNTCRESAAGNIWAYFNHSHFEGSRHLPLIKKLKFDKTRIIIRQVTNPKTKVDEKFNAVIACGIKIANILESKYGWDLTVSKSVVLKDAEKVKNIGSATNIHMVYISGDPRWIHSPQMLTFHMLLLRIGLIPDMLNVKNFTDLENLVKDFGRTRSGDKYYIRTALKFIAVLMKRHEELFDTIANNYSGKNYKHVSVYEGISTLCQGVTANEKLHDRFSELAKKEKIKGVVRRYSSSSY